MNLPHFKLEIDEEDSMMGIQEVSYVEYPATGLGYLAFEETKVQKDFKTLNFNGEYERMTSGVLMMPNTKYLRIDKDGNYYTIEFSAETLKEALIKYLKEDKATSVKLEHEGQSLEGFKGIEHWIIEDENTKSPIFGFSLSDLGYDPMEIPKGTIMKTTYVADETFWNEQILTGNVRGYSIGGLFELIPVSVEEFINKSKEVENKPNNEVSVILDFLKVSNSTIKTKNDIELSFKEDKVFNNNEIAQGTFEFTNGLTIIVKEGVIVDAGFSLITETIETKTEVVEEEIKETLDKGDEDIRQLIDELREEVNNFKNIVNNKEEELNQYKEIIDIKDKEINSLKESFKDIQENTFKQSIIKKEIKTNTIVNTPKDMVEITIGNQKVLVPKKNK